MVHKKIELNRKSDEYFEFVTEKKRTGTGNNNPNRTTTTKKDIKDITGVIRKLNSEIKLALGEIESDENKLKILVDFLEIINPRFTANIT